MKQLTIWVLAIIGLIVLVAPVMVLERYWTARGRRFRTLKVPILIYAGLLGLLGFGILGGLSGWRLGLALVGMLVFALIAFKIHSDFVEQFDPHERDLADKLPSERRE